MAKTKAQFEGASAADVAAPNDPEVWVRVLKAGDGKISTGEHNPRGGDLLYERDERFKTVKSIADALEERHFVEIVDGVEAAKK